LPSKGVLIRALVTHPRRGAPRPNVSQPRPNQDVAAAAAKATYEVELAKLRKEVDELAKTKKRLLVVHQEVDAAKEIQGKRSKSLNCNKNCVS
jgi:hypothetical protein